MVDDPTPRPGKSTSQAAVHMWLNSILALSAGIEGGRQKLADAQLARSLAEEKVVVVVVDVIREHERGTSSSIEKNGGGSKQRTKRRRGV